MKKTIKMLFLLALIPNQLMADDSKDIFKLGVIQSVTGIASEDGNAVLEGVQLAVEEINKKEDIKIKLLFEDDESNSRNTVSVYNNLKVKGVDAVIGATWSFLTNPLIPLSAADNIVVMSSSLAPEATHLEIGKDYFFTNAISIKAYSEVFEKYIKATTPKSIVIVHSNNTFGEAYKIEFQKVIDKTNSEILRIIPSVDYENNDWKAVVLKVKFLKPELVILLLNRNDIDNFIKRSKEVKFNSKMFLSHHGLDAFRLSSNQKQYEDMCLPYPIQQINQKNSFYKMYKIRYNKDPRIYSNSSFDAVYLLHNAFKESVKSKMPINQMLIKTSFDGVVGKYNFDKIYSLSSGYADLVCIIDAKLRITP